MKTLKVALWMELLKVRRTKIFSISVYFFLFIGMMMGLLVFLAMNPEIASRSAALRMKTSFLGEVNWNAYFELLIQIVLALGVLGSGVITSWVFGREFSDRTVKDLLALPVSRNRIVQSKLLVLFVWSLLLSFLVLAAGVLTGFAIKIPGWNINDFFPFLGVYMLCALLNTFLLLPIAFVASAGRGYLVPVSFVILILVLTQLIFVGLPATAIYFPWALPALVSGVGGEGAPAPVLVSYLLYIVLILGSYAATILWWSKADHK